MIFLILEHAFPMRLLAHVKNIMSDFSFGRTAVKFVWQGFFPSADPSESN